MSDYYFYFYFFSTWLLLTAGSLTHFFHANVGVVVTAASFRAFADIAFPGKKCLDCPRQFPPEKNGRKTPFLGLFSLHAMASQNFLVAPTSLKDKN
jgi:hypothetical protein